MRWIGRCRSSRLVSGTVVEDGSRITTTEDHPFWNAADSIWERADQLNPGDALLTAEGGLVRVIGLDLTSARTATAHNLTIADIHTYYVGDVPVAVHNTCFGVVTSRGRSSTATGSYRP
jgi:hypothetical protein